jgi:hypothetical protein
MHFHQNFKKATIELEYQTKDLLVKSLLKERAEMDGHQEWFFILKTDYKILIKDKLNLEL